MNARWLAVPGWRGVVATLIALVMVLGINLRPAEAVDGPPEYDRSDVLVAWGFGGPGVQRAAVAALLGPDEGIQTFMDEELPAAQLDDLRVQVAQVLAIGGPAVRTAADAALSGGEEELQAFLDDTFLPAHDEDLRVQVAQVMAFGGPGVKKAASTALDGTADDWKAFLDKGQYRAREDDNRVRVAQLLFSGGPNVKKLAGQALDGRVRCKVSVRPIRRSGAELGGAPALSEVDAAQ
ncbi:ALF repeat-containing protein, partial [Streptomyces sp. NPDC005780]|uniref:ALF repeat-containing protein n=1 Tax=Streptomyces sp. NPDC005780 TaxID=3364730 RepID=UPI0036B8C5E9